MKSLHFRLLGATALTLSLYAPLALAQDGDDLVQDKVVVVGTVLYANQINALKSPTPIIDVPQSLSIVTADQIARRGFTRVGQIIDYTPGVSMSQGEGHRDAIVFRGVRSTADFFIDGVRDDVEYYRPLYNLEQVEILRGPNALLFGRGGTGGILNRVTKKAETGETFLGYQASFDSFGGFGAQLDANVSNSERAAFRINAMYESLENHRDFFDGARIGVNPTAEFRFGPSTILDVSYEYADHEQFIDRGIPTGSDGRPVEAFRDIVFADPALNTTQLQAHLFRAILQHQFSDSLKGRFSAFLGDYDKLYANFYPSGYDQAVTPDRISIDGYVDTNQRRNTILSGDVIGEFTTGAFGHTVVAGLEYIDTANDNDRFNPLWSNSQDDVEVFTIQRPLNLRFGVGVAANGNPTSTTFSDLNDDTQADVTVFSAYVQDEIEISPRLDIVLGARFDRFEIDVFDVPTASSQSRTDEKVTPRLGLVFKPQENISLYASYSESFLPRSGDQFASINAAQSALDPDEFTNLEAGVKWDFNPGLSFTAAVFEIEQSSPQPADSDPSTLDVIDSQITGFEAQLQGQITEDWFVSAGYSFLDGEQVDRTGPTGLRPRELPETMASVWSAYQLTPAFGLGLGVTYQDDSFANNGNTAVMPAYTRVDAAAYYDLSERVRLQLNIENLTDELYFPSSHSTHEITVGAPLNARLTLSGRF